MLHGALLGSPVLVVPPVESSRPVFWERLVVWVCRCSFKQVLYDFWCSQHTESTSLVWKDVLQEVINMTCNNTYEVHYHRVAQEQGEAQQHPRKIGRLEVDQPEEVEPEVWVTPAPHVHQHGGEGVA
uniref:Putative secreted protein n=1 Tax=Ixodes ricinus TaxID=34613 RepID=A0A6B0UQQ1_IXORI